MIKIFMNIADTTAALSESGPEGMDFVHGGFDVTHIGSPNHGRKRTFILGGRQESPSLAEKNFLNVGYQWYNYKE
jgi:hypothetical protein